MSRNTKFAREPKVDQLAHAAGERRAAVVGHGVQEDHVRRLRRGAARRRKV